MPHLSLYKKLLAKVFSCPGPPRTTATPPSTGSLPTLSLEVSDLLKIAEQNWTLLKITLQAEQQLGFPAGAAAGASSLDTAGPTVSGFPCNAYHLELDLMVMEMFKLMLKMHLVTAALTISGFPCNASSQSYGNKKWWIDDNDGVEDGASLHSSTMSGIPCITPEQH